MTEASAALESEGEAPRRASKGPRRSEEAHCAILDAATALLDEKGIAPVRQKACATRGKGFWLVVALCPEAAEFNAWRR